MSGRVRLHILILCLGHGKAASKPEWIYVGEQQWDCKVDRSKIGFGRKHRTTPSIVVGV